MSRTVIIYGAGDRGTAEVVKAYCERAIAIDRRDIRISQGGRDNLADLMRTGAATVPRVFLAENDNVFLVGGYDEAMAHVARLPALLTGPEIDAAG